VKAVDQEDRMLEVALVLIQQTRFPYNPLEVLLWQTQVVAAVALLLAT
jgi:hypothetical protein